MRIQKLARLGQPVPLLAAFPFEISIGGSSGGGPPSPMGRLEAARNYSTCVCEESVGFLNSKSDVKKDD